MFEIKALSPELYRQQTRRSSFIVIAIFLVLAMLCATASTQLFGGPVGDNFRWNLLGVVVGLALTIAVVRMQLWDRPVMAAAAYGWQLKRCLMQITNVMHQVKTGVAQGDVSAMKVLRFYHLGLMQMHQLEANSAEASHLVAQVDAHVLILQQAGIELEQNRFDPAWITAVKGIKA